MSQYYQIKNVDTDQPEIHIDGPIQMDQSILAVLFGMPEQTAVGIAATSSEWKEKISLYGLIQSAVNVMQHPLSIRR